MMKDAQCPLAQLRLRYFNPMEVARLHCYPLHFQFPDDMTLKQRYKLLGNSLNVRVVMELLKFMFANENDGEKKNLPLIRSGNFSSDDG